MNNLANKASCLSASYANDLHNICQPLLQNTKIDSFHYVKAYQNGRYISLNTNLAVEEFMLIESKGRFQHDVNFLGSAFNYRKLSKNKYNNRTCLFTEDVDRGYWASMFEKYNIKSCFNVIEKSNNYYERFGFSSRLDKTFYSFYVNHFDVLEKFILYFKDYGSKLIKAGEKKRTIWFNHDPQYNKLINDLKETFVKENSLIETLSTCFRIRKYPINNNDIKSYLTIHELKCLQYFGQGFTYKEIGNILQISDRTVETFLRRIRIKLDINSHSQLLKIYHSSALANL